MARFQSHQCIGFHKKEDIIGDLEVPDDVLDFEKYVAKGVIGDLFLQWRFTPVVQTEK